MEKFLTKLIFGSFALILNQFIVSSSLQGAQILSTCFTSISTHSDMFLFVHLNNSHEFIKNSTLHSMQQIILSQENNMTIKNNVRRYQQVSILVIFTIKGIYPSTTVIVKRSIWNLLMLPSTFVLLASYTKLNSASTQNNVDFLCTQSETSSVPILNKCRYQCKLFLNSPAIKVLFIGDTTEAVLLTNGKFPSTKIYLVKELTKNWKLDTLKLH